MTLSNEIQYACDNCGTGDRISDTTMTYVVRLLRSWGWSVGKRILCPDCRGRS